ncbi:MAG: flagellar hook-associated protein FlgK [Candidatus Sulfotelmatobacter sp.]
MGSLSSSMWIAAQALDVDQGALDATSNNIANQNTPGYSREIPVLTEGAPTVEGDVTYGGGVVLQQVQSVTDQLLQIQIADQNQQQSSAQTQYNALQQVQELFSNPTSGIGADFTSFFNSLSQLSTDPTSIPDRQAVLTSAQNLATSFNSTEESLDSIQSGLNQSVSQNVTQINSLTAQIAQINGQVGQMQKLGEDPGNLGDQETALIQQLSQLTNVNQIQTENGLTLTTGNGTPLVVGDQSFALTTTAGPNGMTDVSSQGQDITSTLQGGELGGNLQVRDTVIPGLLSQLDNLASQFSTSVNAAQATGYDLNGNAGQPLFSDTSGPGAASNLTVAITDPNLIAASSDGTQGSNGNVANLLAVQNQALPGGEDPLDTYSSLVSQTGNLTDQAQAEVTASTASLNNLNNQLGSISGVNLDEETTNLMNYQRAYEAAARVVTTVDALTQSVLDMGSGVTAAP